MGHQWGSFILYKSLYTRSYLLLKEEDYLHSVYPYREATGYYVSAGVTFRRVNHDNMDLRSSLLVRCKTQLSRLHSSEEKFYSPAAFRFHDNFQQVFHPSSIPLSSVALASDYARGDACPRKKGFTKRSDTVCIEGCNRANRSAQVF